MCHYFSVLSTTCPTDCDISPGTRVATENVDYTINDSAYTITFSSNPTDFQQPVKITVASDGVEEKREYFCLTITDQTKRGTVWSTRVIIPWNDSKFTI